MRLKGVDFDITFRRLEEGAKIKPFENSKKRYVEFLFEDAENYLKQNLAVTYLFESETHTIAYFCIANDCIISDINRNNMSAFEKTIWNKINRKVPFLKQKNYYPSVKIGQLAVATNYEGIGIGRVIIDAVVSMYRDEVQKAGCRFVTVDSEVDVTEFYIKNGFQFLTDKDEHKNHRAMCLDLKAAI